MHLYSVTRKLFVYVLSLKQYTAMQLLFYSNTTYERKIREKMFPSLYYGVCSVFCSPEKSAFPNLKCLAVVKVIVSGGLLQLFCI